MEHDHIVNLGRDSIAVYGISTQIYNAAMQIVSSSCDIRSDNGITKSLLQTDKWGKDNKSPIKNYAHSMRWKYHKKQNKTKPGGVEGNHHLSGRIVKWVRKGNMKHAS